MVILKNNINICKIINIKWVKRRGIWCYESIIVGNDFVLEEKVFSFFFIRWFVFKFLFYEYFKGC